MVTVKMKTQVNKDRDIDDKEMEMSLANPDRFNYRKMFPNSDWEFDKWNKEDTVGFMLSVLCVFAVVGLMMFLVTVGS